jgi:glycosyl hydrolase family 99
VKTTAALTLLGAALLAPAQSGASPKWSLEHARHVLTTRTFAVTDTSQPDRPDYELVFSRLASKSLRKGFAFAGVAHDTLTDADVRVRFTFKRPGRITAFRGPSADTAQPVFPIHAAFYYAWYPEAWFRDPVYPYSRFGPSLDYYSASDAHVVRVHTDALLYAHLDAGIYSWWGRDGYPPTDQRFWRYLLAARATPLRWAIYYEREGYANPSVEQIRSDLEYIRDTYATSPAYLKVDGRFVVYVYGSAEESCDATAARWGSANTVDAYVVLKAFDGFRACRAQPDAWHQYSAALPEYDFAPDAFMIAPGFDEWGESEPRLGRDLPRWRGDIAAMVASNARWQLVLTFNEWPEGTAVESARQWATPSGYGAYLDALHETLP